MLFCPNCGKKVSEGVKYCPDCGQRLESGFTPEERQKHIEELKAPTGGTLENTSGQGELATVPEGVKGWSWGAFVLTWIWGIFNGVLISLLCLIPFFSLAWAIVLGIKGNEWAWRNKRWDSVEHFKSTQRPWNIVGIVLFVIALAAIIPGVLVPLFLFF